MAVVQSMPTRSSAPAHGRRPCVPPAGLSRSSTACWEATPAPGLPPGARPVITPRRRGRWASACSTTSPARPPAQIRDHGLERVLILDWDVHHGNGTNDLFARRADVFYVSIHQAGLFPNTGEVADHGIGEGTGFTLNLPVPPRSGDDVFCALVEQRAVPLAREYEPELVLISAGFDAHAEDPLADCDVTEEGFARMTAAMRQFCQELGVPLGAVLEGGYALEALARSVDATLVELARGGD